VYLNHSELTTRAVVMDFRLLIRHRLKELGTEQRDRAAAAQVTESYISELLTGKKAPPAPERTDIYDKMEEFLRLPAGKLAMLADRLRMDALKRKLVDRPPGLPSGSVAEGRCDRGGNRVSQEADIHARTADAALLLPRTSEPARPAPFSPRDGRGEEGHSSLCPASPSFPSAVRR